MAPAEMCLFLELLLMLDQTGEWQKLYWVIWFKKGARYKISSDLLKASVTVRDAKSHLLMTSPDAWIEDACFNRAAASIDILMISLHDHRIFSYERKSEYMQMYKVGVPYMQHDKLLVIEQWK